MIPEIFWSYNSYLLVWQLGWRWVQHVSPETWYHTVTHRRWELSRSPLRKPEISMFRSFVLKIHWILASQKSRDKKDDLETGNVAGKFCCRQCGVVPVVVETKTFTIKQKQKKKLSTRFSFWIQAHWKFVNFQWPRIDPSVYTQTLIKRLEEKSLITCKLDM